MPDTPPTPPPHKQSDDSRAWGLYMVAGQSVSCVVATALIGWWIDSVAHTSPMWVLTLSIIGALVGFTHLIRVGMRAMKEEERREGKPKRR